RLLKSFQDDAKYEHGGQDTRLQGGNDNQDEKDKDLKISDEKNKVERQSQKAKDQRSRSMKEQAYNVAFCPGLRFVLDCVLSSIEFCLFEDYLLRFAKDKFCQNQNCIAFCLRILRFAQEESCVLLKKNLAFCLKNIAFCLSQDPTFYVLQRL
nr:hypothetical protein [Tanacetum cinerariifolium]